jgi:peptide/nickel transport system permease protein
MQTAWLFRAGRLADGFGRDELARLIYGARISLTVGFCAPVIGLTIGGALGIRGRFGARVVGSMNVLLAFPPLILALAVTAYLGQSIFNLTHILGVLGIPAFMRVARASSLTLARREFVIAAEALGASYARILLRELLPNVMLPLLAFCSASPSRLSPRARCRSWASAFRRRSQAGAA